MGPSALVLVGLVITQSLLAARSIASAGECSHRPPRLSHSSGGGAGFDASDGFRAGAFSSPRRVRRQTVASPTVTLTEPLRILVHYEPTLAAADDAESLAIRGLINDAVNYWQSVLSVRQQVPAPASFWLPRPCRTDRVRVVRSPVSGAYLHYCADGCSSTAFCGHTDLPANHLDLCRELAPEAEGSSLRHSGSRGAGIQSPFNYVLYVSAYDTVRCGGPDSQTLGYAAHCQLDGRTDRPLAGYVNLCQRLTGTGAGRFTADRAEAQYTARHELLHALGLTATLFAFMRTDSWAPRTPRNPITNLPSLGVNQDSNGSIMRWSSDTVLQRSEPWRSSRGVFNLTRHYVVTPRLVSRVRAHFNCTSLPGLPLENQGEIGSALTHWEKRLLETELMTAAYTGSSLVSEFTLAFLEDTGWYSANYSMAQPIAWGRNLGCEFAFSSCYDLMRRRLILDSSAALSPYCNLSPRHSGPNGGQMLVTGCSDDLKSKRYCNLGQLVSDLPPQYQYFVDDIVQVQQADANYGSFRKLTPSTSALLSRFGGTSRFADYCPYPQIYATLSDAPVTTTNNWQRNSNCLLKENQAVETANPSLELFGSESRCLVQPEPFQLQFCGRRHAAATYGSGCYAIRCAQATGVPIVKLSGGREFACPVMGGRVDFSLVGNFSLHYGSLMCPPCSQLCPDYPDCFKHAALSPAPTPPKLPAGFDREPPCRRFLTRAATNHLAAANVLLFKAVLFVPVLVQFDLTIGIAT